MDEGKPLVNGDGLINWKEFVSGMKQMGLEFSPQVRRCGLTR